MARLGLTVGITLIMAALTAVACGSSKGSSTTAQTDGAGAGTASPRPTPAPGSPPPAAAAEASTATAASGGTATVSTVDNPTEGNILVGPDGRTLYLFDEDHGTMTACTGSCETFWPALAAPKPTAGAGVDGSALSAVNAQVPDQVVYKGHLLYYFSKDTAPGDVNGASIPHWFPLAPDGSKITNG
jgi:predicted lipoprotein with Yx(FWY)xxD motif